MNIGSWLIDGKIKGLNVTVDLTIEEYWQVARNIVEKNDFQRKKVKAKGNAYSLLKRDLLEGCIMPPIILAVTENFGDTISALIREIVEAGTINEDKKETLDSFILDAFEQKELIILDGLQRTFTIESALNEASPEELKSLREHLIRVEIYLGLSKMGILYRMLTLNTGQTPMSFRHQLEMLYHDYIDKGDLPDGISVVREIDESRARGIGMYKYQDVIDLFYSYNTGSPQSVDKETLVSRLKELEFLENYTSESEDMLALLELYHKFVVKINEESNEWKFSNEELSESVARPFGTTITSILGKTQSMTGFGSACSRLIKAGLFANLSQIKEIINKLQFGEESIETSLNRLVIILDQISKNASKIGNAQRAYFELAYRELLNPESDSFCDLTNCWVSAQEKYNVLY